MKLVLTTVALSIATALTLTPSAQATARHFSSCSALNRVYPHGVGAPDARDHSSTRRVTNFTHNLALYRANNGPRNQATGEYDLDRDNDRIACEKL